MCIIQESSEEIWEPYPEFIGYFEVSNMGRVRSVDRVTTRSDTGKQINIRGKILTQQINRLGYCTIRTSVDSTRVTLRPHRAVAKVFVPNTEDKPEVNHKNGIKLDNRAINLEWVTASENQIHAINTGLKENPKGVNSHAFKRAVDVYKENVYITTLNGSEEMIEFGVDPRMVSACLLGKRKSHKGFVFKKQEEQI